MRKRHLRTTANSRYNIAVQAGPHHYEYRVYAPAAKPAAGIALRDARSRDSHKPHIEHMKWKGKSHHKKGIDGFKASGGGE